MRRVKVLLVSSDPKMRELMAVAVASVERALSEPTVFFEAADGVEGIRRAWRERPDIVVAEESSSRAGAFALAKDLRGAAEPFPGGIVILLDRAQDWWLAQWSGADAWFTKPVDPFALADTVIGLVQRNRNPDMQAKETA
jgi:DNA-binding response OmpR family regulator